MIQDIPDPEWMLREELAPAFEAMIDHGLVFDALVMPSTCRRCCELTARYPDLAMVLDHGAKPPIAAGDIAGWKQRDRGARARSAHRLQAVRPGHRSGQRRCRGCSGLPSITCSRVSAPRRLMWGSDWPVCELVCSYDEWRERRDMLLQCLDAHRTRADLFRNMARADLWNLRRLSGKTAVVTAAGSGIGRASAESFRARRRARDRRRHRWQGAEDARGLRDVTCSTCAIPPPSPRSQKPPGKRRRAVQLRGHRCPRARCSTSIPRNGTRRSSST